MSTFVHVYYLSVRQIGVHFLTEKKERGARFNLTDKHVPCRTMTFVICQPILGPIIRYLPAFPDPNSPKQLLTLPPPARLFPSRLHPSPTPGRSGGSSGNLPEVGGESGGSWGGAEEKSPQLRGGWGGRSRGRGNPYVRRQFVAPCPSLCQTRSNLGEEGSYGSGSQED